ncbi:response regulator [Echinimonas agarilytica]|uniref:Response regulator n=1 Tax=Echinimonas agarilytica TaxID=1215918 RepID=A0AA41W682_9GAMM|nr:response regulator [Echinimonas agarilytica]MCM2679381.1 response regulator [Echinimonas agarilytica]
MASVLIVEDEPKLASILVDYLTQSDYHTQWVDHGNAAIEAVHRYQPDVILLDVMLPGKDGMTLCKEIRQFSDVPILMLTARVEEIDRLLGLELGADDYICKPFSPREVVARVKAILRRVGPKDSDGVSHTGFSLDETKFMVAYNGVQLELTVVEFHILKMLHREPGRVFSRDQLMSGMYQDNRIVSERTIDSHIKKLRKKLLTLDDSLELIQSVYGAGYRFMT